MPNRRDGVQDVFVDEESGEGVITYQSGGHKTINFSSGVTIQDGGTEEGENIKTINLGDKLDVSVSNDVATVDVETISFSDVDGTATASQLPFDVRGIAESSFVMLSVSESVLLVPLAAFVPVPRAVTVQRTTAVPVVLGAL